MSYEVAGSTISTVKYSGQGWTCHFLCKEIGHCASVLIATSDTKNFLSSFFPSFLPFFLLLPTLLPTYPPSHPFLLPLLLPFSPCYVKKSMEKCLYITWQSSFYVMDFRQLSIRIIALKHTWDLWIPKRVFSSVQLLSHIRLFVIPWIATRQASLFITNSGSLFKLMPIKSVMPSSHLILCHPLLLLPPNPSQHQGLFQWVNSSHEVAKVLEFQEGFTVV